MNRTGSRNSHDEPITARGYTQADREKDTISPAKQAASAAEYGTPADGLAASLSQSAVESVRNAEHEVERAAWNVHCIEYAAERAELQAAKNRARAAEARDALAVKRQVLAAVAAQFPEVELQEVDLHGVE